MSGAELSGAAREFVKVRSGRTSAFQDALVVAGGDGTISAAAAALAGSDLPLGFIPLGTLNHFAKDLGLPLCPVGYYVNFWLLSVRPRRMCATSSWRITTWITPPRDRDTPSLTGSAPGSRSYGSFVCRDDSHCAEVVQKTILLQRFRETWHGGEKYRHQVSLKIG